MMIARQGDIGFVARVELPEDAVRVEARERYVIARGEVTGHEHAIESLDGVEVYATPDGTRFLHVTQDVDVTHQEHGVVTLPEGTTVEIRRQRRYLPEGAQWVAD